MRGRFIEHERYMEWITLHCRRKFLHARLRRNYREAFGYTNRRITEYYE